jgi:hypothetical protein
VSEDGSAPALILVLEDGMSQKPSILFTLSAADILRYWALLRPEQRTAFLEERLGAVPEALLQLGLDESPIALPPESMFSTFAGVYHAFGTLDRTIRDALTAGRQKEAEYRLLGKKYDSLPHLLDRVLKSESGLDLVGRYVVVLCAKQLVTAIEREEPQFVASHRGKFRDLKRTLAKGARLREQFAFGSSADREAFLDWFDQWFLARAGTREVAT